MFAEEKECPDIIINENIKYKIYTLMACDNITLKGILLDCSSSLGGIKKVWMTQYSDVESVTMDDTSQMIKSITLKSSKT